MKSKSIITILFAIIFSISCGNKRTEEAPSEELNASTDPQSVEDFSEGKLSVHLGEQKFDLPLHYDSEADQYGVDGLVSLPVGSKNVSFSFFIPDEPEPLRDLKIEDLAENRSYPFEVTFGDYGKDIVFQVVTQPTKIEVTGRNPEVLDRQILFPEKHLSLVKIIRVKNLEDFPIEISLNRSFHWPITQIEDTYGITRGDCDRPYQTSVNHTISSKVQLRDLHAKSESLVIGSHQAEEIGIYVEGEIPQQRLDAGPKGDQRSSVGFTACTFAKCPLPSACKLCATHHARKINYHFCRKPEMSMGCKGGCTPGSEFLVSKTQSQAPSGSHFHGARFAGDKWRGIFASYEKALGPHSVKEVLIHSKDAMVGGF